MKISTALLIVASLAALSACAYPPRQGLHQATPYDGHAPNRHVDKMGDERTAGDGVW